MEAKLNPDLNAIRIASVNPILDPWIYILLRKTVVQKILEKIKCLFCHIGGRRHGRSTTEFHCGNGIYSSSVMSRDLPSLALPELPEVISTSQMYLYPMEAGQEMGCCGGTVQSRSCSTSTEQTLLQDSQVVELSSEENRMEMGTDFVKSHSSTSSNTNEAQCSKHQPLQVTFTDESLSLRERSIWCMLWNSLSSAERRVERWNTFQEQKTERKNFKKLMRLKKKV